MRDHWLSGRAVVIVETSVVCRYKASWRLLLQLICAWIVPVSVETRAIDTEVSGVVVGCT